MESGDRTQRRKVAKAQRKIQDKGDKETGGDREIKSRFLDSSPHLLLSPHPPDMERAVK
jgi:hypothetical protein